jgi:hypothetical protein
MPSSQWIREPYFPEMSVPLIDYGMGWFLGVDVGTRYISHGGDSLGHHSLASLHPDWNMTSFTTSTGPNENFQATVRELLNIFIVDAFQGRMPWVNVSNTCNFPCDFAPCPPPVPRAAAVASKPVPAGPGPSRAEFDIVGSYANPGYGTLTISVPSSGSAPVLNLFSFSGNVTGTRCGCGIVRHWSRVRALPLPLSLI